MKLLKLNLLIISILLISFIVYWLVYLFTPSFTGTDSKIYFLHPGINKQVLIKELADNEIISSPILFNLYVSLQVNKNFKTGEYNFSKGSTPISIWNQIIKGNGLVIRSFTIVPGWTFLQLRNELAKNKYLKSVTKKLSDQEIRSYLKPPPSRNLTTHVANFSLEGQFYPDTYSYTRGVSDLIILKNAYNLMQQHLQVAWLARDKTIPFTTPYQALIAASLIEKEAYLKAEKPIISGVLVNRLRKKMLLQFDPTVIYGLGKKYLGKIYKSDLTDNNLYNTYLYKGLPPTPIALPSLGSIEAALHPQLHEYLYFVARGDGSHQFSKTLPEHYQAIQTRIKKTGEKPDIINQELLQKHIQKIFPVRIPTLNDG